jgi:hypothetical protein
LEQGFGAEFFLCAHIHHIDPNFTGAGTFLVNHIFLFYFSGWFRGFSTKNRSIKVRGFYSFAEV